MTSPDARAEKLVYMANQIGTFFAHQPDEAAIAAIARHIESFWEKRMLAQIFAHLDSGGAGLNPRPAAALQNLAAKRHLMTT